MIARIDPILLFVKDFTRSLSFYRDVLGLKVRSHEPVHEQFAQFELGGTTFAIHGGYKGKPGGPIHLHFEVRDIRKSVKALKSKGAKFSGPIEKMPWGTYETSFVDPDGNEFDLTQPIKA